MFKRTASGVSPSHQPHTNLDEIRSGWDLDIANDVEHGRWEAIVLNDTIGEISYRFVGGRLVLLSTWVDRLYRQQRIATELIARVLDEIRDSGNTQTSSTKSTPGAYPSHKPAAEHEEELLTAFEPLNWISLATKRSPKGLHHDQPLAACPLSVRVPG